MFAGVNPARAGMIRNDKTRMGLDRSKPRASGDDPVVNSNHMYGAV